MIGERRPSLRRARGQLGHKVDPGPFFADCGLEVVTGWPGERVERWRIGLLDWFDHTVLLRRLYGSRQEAVGFLTEPYRLHPGDGYAPPFDPAAPFIRELAERINEMTVPLGIALHGGFWNPPWGLPLVIGADPIQRQAALRLRGDREWLAADLTEWWQEFRAPLLAEPQ